MANFWGRSKGGVAKTFLGGEVTIAFAAPP